MCCQPVVISFPNPPLASSGSDSLFDSLPALGRIFTCCCRVCVGVHRSHEVAVPRTPGRDDLLGVALYIYLGMDVVVRRETQMALLVHCCSRCAGVGLLSFMLMSSHRAMIQIDLLKQLTTSCVCVYIYPKPNH